MADLRQTNDVMRILRDAGLANDDQWEIRRIAVGGQGEVFLARACASMASEGKAEEWIVKFFDPSKPEVDNAARDEFETLARLHDLVDGTVCGDWTIHAPRPSYLTPASSDRPWRNALVMTFVPGVPLATLMRQPEWSQCGLGDSLAPTIVSVLERFWSRTARLYGDLNFRNILVDPATRVLSLIDCGIPEQAWLCNDVRMRWFPASRDLAYLLFSAAVEWRRSIGNPQARQDELRLARNTLGEFLRRIEPASASESALYEIMACADQHLARVRRSWSPRGIWRSFIRLKAEQCMDEVFGLLQNDLATRGEPEILVAEASH